MQNNLRKPQSVPAVLFNDNIIYEQAEAEVVPSSSLVEVGVEAEVGIKDQCYLKW